MLRAEGFTETICALTSSGPMPRRLTSRLPGRENLQCILHGETTVTRPWAGDHGSKRRGQCRVGTPTRCVHTVSQELPSTLRPLVVPCLHSMTKDFAKRFSSSNAGRSKKSAHALEQDRPDILKRFRHLCRPPSAESLNQNSPDLQSLRFKQSGKRSKAGSDETVAGAEISVDARFTHIAPELIQLPK